MGKGDRVKGLEVKFSKIKIPYEYLYLDFV